jgi:hypothetical protein
MIFPPQLTAQNPYLIRQKVVYPHKAQLFGTIFILTADADKDDERKLLHQT